jgi:DNA repair protein RadC
MAEAMLKEVKEPHLKSHEEQAYYYYKTFLDNWNQADLNSKAGYKVLFLNQENKPFFLWSDDDQNIDPQKALLAARENKAFGIVLAFNDPNDHVEPDYNASTLFENFKRQSKEFSIRLKDFLIMSKWSYHSFLENKRI